MALVIADRVKENSTTTGTGALTLVGAMIGFQTFAAKCAVGDTCFYALQGVDGSGAPTGEWECGLGTYSAANTLTRTTVTSSSNAGAAVVLSAGTKQVYISMPAVQVAWAREKLTADRTYYVATTGSDSNDGLAVGTPFLTVQKAINAVAAIDLSTFSVVIQIADGTYTGTVLANNPWVGSGTVTIQGNATTPANVVLTSAGDTVCASNGCAISVSGLKVSSTAGKCLYATSSGYIKYGNMDIGAATGPQIRADLGGTCECVANYTISGAAPYHLRAEELGVVKVRTKTVTITGTPAFSGAFLSNILHGHASVDGNTFSGSATGKRYELAMNSVCYVAGAAATYLPGDVAGTTATGGQYA